MEFTCTFLNIKLSKIFQVKFCTNYEKCIHIVLNFREISVSDILQHTGSYKQCIWHTATYRQVQTVYLTYRKILAGTDNLTYGNISAGTNSVSDIPQPTGRYRQCIWHTATYRHVHTHIYPPPHTHTHTHQQHCTYLRRNIFCVSYPVFPLRYEAVFSSCPNFHTNSYSCIFTAKRHIVWFHVWHLFFYNMLIFTPLHFCTPLLYLSPCPTDPSPHPPVQSRTVQRPTAQHSTALLRSAVPL